MLYIAHESNERLRPLLNANDATIVQADRVSRTMSATTRATQGNDNFYNPPAIKEVTLIFKVALVPPRLSLLLHQ